MNNGPTIPGTCVRRAWLDLNGTTLDLEDSDGGYFCTSLDLGYPDVRENTAALPDRDGIYDATQLFGARTVSADITAVLGAGAQIDDVASRFAPFMRPSVRTTLHWILDRPGEPERTMTLRAAGYGWKVEGDSQRDIALSWVAADPVAYGADVHTSTAWAGYGTSGRTYPLTFPRVYPSGGQSATRGTILLQGDLPVWPTFRIYGPISAPVLNVLYFVPGSSGVTMRFLAGFQIPAGSFVEINCSDRTVTMNGDPAQSLLSSVDWGATRWPYIQPPPSYSQFTVSGGLANQVTQAQAFWRDAYIS